jgi:DHA1 family multidrug resistance protein-like MFS transporter
MLRESSIGHIVRFLSRDKILSWPNEQAKFEYAIGIVASEQEGRSKETVKAKNGTEDVESANSTFTRTTKSIPLHNAKSSEETILVGWYSFDDQENPQNWSNLKRYSVGLLIW